MSCDKFFYTGTDTRVTVELLDADGNIFPIPLTAVVTAALVDVRNDRQISNTKTVLSTDTDNDWPAGVVAFELTAAETAIIAPGVYGVEVKVVDTEISKARIPYAIEVIKTII